MTESGWPSPPQDTAPANVEISPLAVNGEILADPMPKASSRLRLSTVADVKRQMRLGLGPINRIHNALGM